MITPEKKIVATVVFSLLTAVVAPAYSAPAAKSKNGPFHLTLFHPVNAGERREIVGACRIIEKSTGNSAGVTLGDLDDYIDVSYDEMEKVTQVTDNGNPIQFRVFFKSLKMRDDDHSALEPATSEGVPIDITVWPDLSVAREDGEDIPDDEGQFLRELYHKEDPSNTQSQKVLEPSREVSVGDTWQSPTAEISRFLQKQGLVIPDNGGKLTMKVTGRKKVRGVDCLVLTENLICPHVDGDTSLPDDFRSVHGSFERKSAVYVPIDPNKGIMGDSITERSKYMVVINKDDQTVQVNMDRTVTRSETTVSTQ